MLALFIWHNTYSWKIMTGHSSPTKYMADNLSSIMEARHVVLCLFLVLVLHGDPTFAGLWFFNLYLLLPCIFLYNWWYIYWFMVDFNQSFFSPILCLVIYCAGGYNVLRTMHRRFLPICFLSPSFYLFIYFFWIFMVVLWYFVVIKIKWDYNLLMCVVVFCRNLLPIF